MDIQKLTNLKTEIENIDKIHHIKILQILINNDVKYSENRNGIFVNMNSFNDKTIGEIQTMLLYIKEQEKNLNDIENIKHELNNDYFSNNNKDNLTGICKS